MTIYAKEHREPCRECGRFACICTDRGAPLPAGVEAELVRLFGPDVLPWPAAPDRVPGEDDE